MTTRIRIALLVAQLIALATFVRAAMAIPTHIFACSTTLAAAGLFAGATAALRARTWGVGLAFASAVAFGAAAALEMGPAWFWWVAVAGAIPQLLCLRPFARFDRGAAALFVVGSAAAGLSAALAWNEVAPLIRDALAG
jgi:hypothetical protein